MAPIKGHKGYPFLNSDQKDFMQALREKSEKMDVMEGDDHSANEIRNIVEATEIGILTYREGANGLRRI